MNPAALPTLGVVQGLTEFLPVSSSGHLALLGNFFGAGLGLAVPVALHVATLAAVVVFFRNDIVSALSSWRAVLLVAASTAPTGAIGLLLKSRVENIFAGSVSWVYAFLATTGVILFAAEKFRRAAAPAGASVTRIQWERISFFQALVVGTAQGVAVLPGISRSGATICAALASGVDRAQAARFSFLVSIPAVTGAALLEVKESFTGGPPIVFSPSLALAMALSFAAGLFAISFLIKAVALRRLHYFSYYLWAAAAAGFLFAR